MQKRAELALIYAIPILSDAEDNSRLANLQRKLQKAVIPCMEKITGFSDSELERMLAKIISWGEETGWLNNAKHTGTLVSFCVEMIETSPFTYPDKITNILEDIIFHMENGNELKSEYCQEGSLAADKWKVLFTA